MDAKERIEMVRERVPKGTMDTDWLNFNLDEIGKALEEHQQYKAIEQELGIDLITLFKALKEDGRARLGYTTFGEVWFIEKTTSSITSIRHFKEELEKWKRI